MLELSVVLTTYNRTALLTQVLRSFKSQTLPTNSFELIVIDDGSIDDTADVITQIQKELDFSYVYQPNAGLAAAKNHGLALARAPIVLFLDDDDMLDPNMLAEHVLSHQTHPEQEVAVLGYTRIAEAIASDPLMHFVTEVGGYLFSFSSAVEHVPMGYDYFWGGRSSCKRNFALQSGGFNPIFRFGCEDIELGYRLSKRGLKVFYNPRAVNIMLRRIAFDAFCDRLRRQGNSQYIFSRLWREPEAQRWCEIPSFYSEWSAIAPHYDQIIERARSLDTWARKSVELNLPVEAEVQQILYMSYYEAFKGSKLAGIAEMQRAWRDPSD